MKLGPGEVSKKALLPQFQSVLDRELNPAKLLNEPKPKKQKNERPKRRTNRSSKGNDPS